MPNLVSIDYARKHLNTYSSQDTDVEAKTALASAIVLNHLKLTEIPEEWYVESAEGIPPIQLIETEDSPALLIKVPGNVSAAVLLIASELFENRESSTGDPLSPAVVSLLAGYRDPTLA